ncbi:MAG TPA: hypothetical protein EYN10_10120 [Gammaproteobacteria bacterium]|nr:hypothetical protein [Gammaproteobacteria bacterium]
METQPLTFVLVMAALALIGVVVFVVYLVVRNKEGLSVHATSGSEPSSGQRWFEYLLAVLALVALVIAVIVVIVFLYPSGIGPEAAWRGSARSMTFLVAMLVVGLGALVAFVIGMFIRRRSENVVAETEIGSVSSAPDPAQTPAGSRLIGLLVLAIAFLVLNWVYVDAVGQYRLMTSLIYPAVLGVALVLLFDKATRAWSIKTKGEPFREWVFCDAAVFLVFLGFLNLIELAAGESYSALFWDLLNLVLFLFVFWLVDRKVSRYRFLVAYGYFALAPILLYIWRLVHVVEDVVDVVPWWSSVWPFFILAIIFMVIEIIALIATRGSQKQGGGSVRDTVFIVLYGILLLGVAP